MGGVRGPGTFSTQKPSKARRTSDESTVDDYHSKAHLTIDAGRGNELQRSENNFCCCSDPSFYLGSPQPDASIKNSKVQSSGCNAAGSPTNEDQTTASSLIEDTAGIPPVRLGD